jgi:beta-lactam-binding protein with PASTA domain
VANAGLYYSVVEVEDNEPAGTALSTDPQAGTLVDPGATVTIYYSGGRPERTASPRDNNQGEARAEENNNQGEGNARGARGEDRGNQGNRGRGNRDN